MLFVSKGGREANSLCSCTHLRLRLRHITARLQNSMGPPTANLYLGLAHQRYPVFVYVSVKDKKPSCCLCLLGLLQRQQASHGIATSQMIIAERTTTQSQLNTNHI